MVQDFQSSHVYRRRRQDGNEDQIAFGCELIAQSTLLSRGDSGGGSVCDDERHGSGVGNDCRDGGDDSGAQRRRISSDGDSNGGSGDLKDSDGFNDDRGFAGICNSATESVNDYKEVSGTTSIRSKARLVGAVTAAV